MAVIGAVGNVLNLIVIPRLRNESFGEAARPLTWGATADLVTALMLFQWHILKDQPGLDITGIVTGLAMTGAPASSASIIVFINLERYIHITRPLTYSSIVTKNKAVLAAGFAFVYNVFLILLVVFTSGKSLQAISYQDDLGLCMLTFSSPSFFMLTVVCFSCGMWLHAVLLFIMYAKIIHIAARHMRQISIHDNAAQRLKTISGTSDANQGNVVNNQEQAAVENVSGGFKRRGDHRQRFDRDFYRRIYRSLRTPLLVTGFYLLAWLPFTAVITYAAATGTTVAGGTFRAVAMLAVGNCIVNVFLYSITRKDYRMTLRRVLWKR